MNAKQSAWDFASFLTYLPIEYGQKNLIMNYHSVSDEDLDFYGNISTDLFRSHMKFFSNFNFVDLPKILEVSGQKEIALTFDDGYENFYTDVFPILKEFDAPATVFITPSHIGDQNIDNLMNSHGISSIERTVMMDGEQIRDLIESDIVSVGNHTMTHADLSCSEELNYEIVESKKQIEELFDIHVDRFSYPYGQKDENSLDIVSETHKYGVGEYRKLVESGDNQHDLPRIAGDQSLRNIKWLTSDISHEIRKRYRSFEISKLA